MPPPLLLLDPLGPLVVQSCGQKTASSPGSQMLLPQNDPLDDELDAPPAPDEEDALVLDEDDALAPDDDDVLAPEDDVLVLAPDEEEAPPVPLLDPPVPKRSVSPTPPHAKAESNRAGGAARSASARSCMTRLQGDRRGSLR